MAIVCTGKNGPVPSGAVIAQCAACFGPILPGQYFTQVPVGCGSDPKNRALARMNLSFAVISVAVHWACVQGDESTSSLEIPS